MQLFYSQTRFQLLSHVTVRLIEKNFAAISILCFVIIGLPTRSHAYSFDLLIFSILLTIFIILVVQNCRYLYRFSMKYFKRQNINFTIIFILPIKKYLCIEIKLINYCVCYFYYKSILIKEMFHLHNFFCNTISFYNVTLFVKILSFWILINSNCSY